MNYAAASLSLQFLFSIVNLNLPGLPFLLLLLLGWLVCLLDWVLLFCFFWWFCGFFVCFGIFFASLLCCIIDSIVFYLHVEITEAV